MERTTSSFLLAPCHLFSSISLLSSPLSISYPTILHFPSHHHILFILPSSPLSLWLISSLLSSPFHEKTHQRPAIFKNSNLPQSYISPPTHTPQCLKARKNSPLFTEWRNSFQYCSGYRGQLWLAINFTHT